MTVLKEARHERSVSWTGIVSRQFPSLTGTMLRNNASSTRNGSIRN